MTLRCRVCRARATRIAGLGEIGILLCDFHAAEWEMFRAEAPGYEETATAEIVAGIVLAGRVGVLPDGETGA